MFCVFNNTIPPINAVRMGYNHFNDTSGPFTYTLTFSQPINNLHILISGGGNSPGDGCVETINFTTDSGTPNIGSSNYCNATFGLGQINFSLPLGSTYGSDGLFKISTDVPFTSITMSGPGGCNGVSVKFCSDFTT